MDQLEPSTTVTLGGLLSLFGGYILREVVAAVRDRFKAKIAKAESDNEALITLKANYNTMQAAQLRLENKLDEVIRIKHDYEKLFVIVRTLQSQIPKPACCDPVVDGTEEHEDDDPDAV